jgi:CRP/FNR family transcriptional regulator, cyclic AMP receptor protein
MPTDALTGARISHFLRSDADLAESVPTELRAGAIDECIAPVIALQPGVWDGTAGDSAANGIGLLVLQGLLIRRVGIDDRFGSELLGEGDLLRPWQNADAVSSLPRTTGWRVLTATRLAYLDRRVAVRLARYPELTGRLVARALDRSRNLAANMAIVQQSRIDVRLRMLLWLLADRWGRVGSRGVTVPLALTHSVLAELVAARRPTVTTALGELAQRGEVEPLARGWLLLGEPPRELLEVRDLAVAPDAQRSPAAVAASSGRSPRPRTSGPA